MYSEDLFELEDLERFFKENNYDISRATITRYGQNGLILAPRRKERVGTLSGPRIYYHPLVAIEILTANLLLSGNYLGDNLRYKIGRFTLDDIFFARINYYRCYRETYMVSKYDSIIRVQEGKKYKSYQLSMKKDILDRLYDVLTDYDFNPAELENRNADIIYLKNRFTEFENRFVQSERKLRSDLYQKTGCQDFIMSDFDVECARIMQRKYSELILDLYARTMTLLWCKHQRELEKYRY